MRRRAPGSFGVQYQDCKLWILEYHGNRDHDDPSRAAPHSRSVYLEETRLDLSGRAVFHQGTDFLLNLVIFSCQESTWREDVHLEDGLARREAGGLLTINKAGGDANHAVHLFQNLINQYLSRTLTRGADIENAFAGVAGLMDGLVGTLWHGIPERYFDRVVQDCWFWDYTVHVRPSFPSWSWTGWKYTAAHVEAGGITALPTWKDTPLLQFFAVFDNPRSLASGFPTNASHHAYFLPTPEEMAQTFTRFTEPQHDGLLVFYTGYTIFKVKSTTKAVFDELNRNKAHEYQVVNTQTGRAITSIRLKENHVAQHPGLLPFIVISYSRAGGAYRLMLIEEIGGIAYKINVTVPGRPVQERDWWDARPQKKLVIMG